MIRSLSLVLLILMGAFNASAGNNDSSEKRNCNWKQANQYLKKFQFKEALPILTKCYQKNDSSNAVIEQKLALAYFKLGRFKPAQFHYQNVLKNDTGNLAVLNRLALIKLKTAHYEEAETYYQKLITTDSSNSYYYSQLAKLAKKNGNGQKAASYYRKTLTINEKDVNAISQLGELLLNQEAFKSTRKWVKRGLALDSNNLRLRGLKTKLAYHQQKYDQVASTTAYIFKMGDSTKTYLKLSGIAHLQLGHYQKVIHYLQKANGPEVKSAIIPYYLGMAYRKVGETSKATNYINQAVEKGTSKYLALFYKQLAHTYENGKKYSAAIKAFHKAYKHSENEQLLYHLARTYDTYYKDKKPAIRFYQKYLAKHDTTHEEMVKYARQRVNRLKQIKHFHMDSLASNSN